MWKDASKDLQTKLTAEFDHWKTEKPDFDLTFKRIVSGKYQVVTEFRYKVTLEATNTANKVKTCEADIVEEFSQKFDLKCDNQKHQRTKQFRD